MCHNGAPSETDKERQTHCYDAIKEGRIIITGEEKTENNNELINSMTDDIFKHGSGYEGLRPAIRFPE